MALTCSSSVGQLDAFEFIDCSTINISYDSRGIASVSFAVVTSRKVLLNNYTSLAFGGVNFKLYVQDVQVSKIAGTSVYIFQLTLLGFGC
jgi:hypothetical protein